MVISDALPDYYAALQVHPDADLEVIEAAYRQLMKKHHPDLAGDDPRQAAEKHRRATEINRAFAVLRSPDERRNYDLLRQIVGTRRPPPSASTAQPQASPARSPQPSQVASNPAPPSVPIELPEEPSTLPPPLAWLATAYYMLPGKYEWEQGRGQELFGVLMVPVVGSLGFALSTGRLTPLLGHSLGSTLLAWATLALLSLPLVQLLPRVVAACGPGALLLTGTLNPFLAQGHVPIWLAWAATAFIGVFLAARVYLFGFLPTLALIWLLTRF